MIQNLTVCICDICGKTSEAKVVGSQYNESIYAQPDGWSKGTTKSVDICPECAKKLKTVWREEKLKRET